MTEPTDVTRKSRNLLRDASALAGIRILIRFVGILVGLVVARVLGPEGLGALSIPNLMLSLGPFLGLGFADGLVRELPRADHKTAQDLRSTAWTLTLMMAGLALLLAYLPFHGILSNLIPGAGLLLLAMSAFVTHGAYKFAYSDLVGRRSVRRLGELQVLQGLVRGALVLLLLWLLPEGQRTLSLHAGASISFLLCLVWVFLLDGRMPRLRLQLSTFRVLLRSGPAIALAGFSIVFLVTGDRLFLKAQLSQGEMGLFEQAVLIRDSLLLLPGVLLTLLVPDYAGRNRRPERRAKLLLDVRRHSRTVAVLTPLLLGALALQVRWVTGLLLPDYLPGVVLYQFTCVAMLPVFLAHVPVSLLLADNKGHLVAIGALGGISLTGMLDAGMLHIPLIELTSGTVPAAWPAVQHSLAGFLFYAFVILAGIWPSLKPGAFRVTWMGFVLVILSALALWLSLSGMDWLPANGIWLGISLTILVIYQKLTGRLTSLWASRKDPGTSKEST